MIFHSKPDKRFLLVALIFISCLAIAVALPILFIPQLRLIDRFLILGIGFMVVSFIAWYLLVVKYTLTAHGLVAQAGPFKRFMPYEHILFVHQTMRRRGNNRIANAQKALTLYAIRPDRPTQLREAEILAQKHGESINNYLMRFIADSTKRSTYLKEGFDPSILQRITISPYEQSLFVTELLRYLDTQTT